MKSLRIIRWFLAMGITLCIAYGQRIGLGVTIGALVSEPFTTTPVSTTYTGFVQSVHYLPNNHRLILGPTAELRLPKRLSLRIAPEIRYCRWVSPSFRKPDGGLVSRANQVEFLLKLGF